RTRRQILGLGIFGFVVADAALAGHEDHATGADRVQIARIVPGTGIDLHARIAARLRRTGDSGLHLRGEFRRLRSRDAADADLADTRMSLADALNGIPQDRKSTRLNSSHVKISYAVFCLKKKKRTKAPAS